MTSWQKMLKTNKIIRNVRKSSPWITRLCVAMCCLTAVFFFLVPREPIPTYGDKSLHFWLWHLSRGDAGNFGQLNTMAWTNFFDLRAVPYLLAVLDKEETNGNRFYKSIWIRLPTVISARMPPPASTSSERRAAMFILGMIGKDAEPAVPRVTVIWEGNGEFYTRKIAAECLQRIDHDDRRLSATMVKGLIDSDSNVRRKSAEILGMKVHEPDLVVPSLIGCLHDNNPAVRYDALKALATYSSTSNWVVIISNCICTAASDPSPFVRTVATNLIQNIQAKN